MDLDLRIVVVLLPLAAAAGWALFNIGQAALKQFQTFNSK
jgi:photosystem II PsbY protein